MMITHEPCHENLLVECFSTFFLTSSFGRNIKITGILYLHRINDNRMTQPPLPHYQMFRRLCGEGFHARVLLVTTMWEKLWNQDDGERRVVVLRRHWSEMIDKGSAVVCHDGTKQSAWSVVKVLVNECVNHAREPSIQVLIWLHSTDHRANSPRFTGITRPTTPTTNHLSLGSRSLPPSSLSVPVDPRSKVQSRPIGAEASSIRPQEVRDLTNWSRPSCVLTMPTIFRSVRQYVILSTSCSFVCLPSLSLDRYTEIWSALSLASAESHVNHCFPFGHVRHDLFILPCCQIYSYLSIVLWQPLRPGYHHGCILRNGLTQTPNIFTLSSMGLSTWLKMPTLRQ
jgi:hypothetical protein